MSLVPSSSPLSLPAAAKVVAIQAIAAIGVVIAVARSLGTTPADAVWGVFAPIAAATAVLLLLFGWTQRGVAAGAAAESDTRFRAIFGLAPVGMLVIDAAGRILETNAAFLAMMRSRPEELVGRSVREFTHHDDWAASKPLRRDALAGRNDSYRVETRYLRSDGTYVWGRLSVSAMRDGDGVVRRWVAAVEDLTGARESEARFRSLAELTSDWFWEQDADLRFTRFWGRPLKLGALALDSLLGARPADSPHFRVSPERWAEHASALRRHERFREFEIPVDTGDGRTYYLSLSGEPRFDANGAFAGYHGVARDVTAQRAAALETERQRALLRQVIDAVPSAVAVRDSRHRYRLVNQARAALYGLTPKALVGKTDEELPRLGEEVRAQWRSDDRALASALPLAPYEQALTLVDGEQRWFQVTKTRIAGIDGEADMVLTVATDLTERRRMEEELRESVERFRALVETLR